MIYLDPESLNVRQAKKQFHNRLIDELYKRIDNLKGRMQIDFFNNSVNDILDEILIAPPRRLAEISDELSPQLLFPQIRKAVTEVFDYDWFIAKRINRYDGYDLAEALGVKTCLYCNRNYTITVVNDDEKVTRPQFDHYFDRNSHPLLALSFFNLIPSCSICNSGLKGSEPFKLATHIHPYVDHIIEQVEFSYKYDNSTMDGLKVTLDTTRFKKSEVSLKVFAIEEIYNAHTDILYDLLKTRQAFSDKYLSVLQDNLLKDVVISPEEMYRIVFGTEYTEENFVKRPFSKFKKDILKKLEIIGSIPQS